MAKEKKKTSTPHKHLHARVSYLQQIAMRLAMTTEKASSNDSQFDNQSSGLEAANESHAACSTTQSIQPDNSKRGSESGEGTVQMNGSTRLASHLCQIARRSQIRLPPTVKHQICKRCSTILIEGSSSKKYVENLSKDGKKAHADILVVECEACGMLKRFPVGARRPAKKGKRQSAADSAKT